MRTTTKPVLDRICTPPYRQTAKDAPFKPGDEVQFKVETLRGRGYFLGQVWSGAPDDLTYWIATTTSTFALVHRSDLELVRKRGEEPTDFVIEVA